MSSRLQRDEALENEDRIDEMKKIKKKKKNSPPVPHLLQAQQAPVLPYAKVVGRPGTGNYPAPSPDPTLENTFPIGSQTENMYGAREDIIILENFSKLLKNCN